MNSAGSTTATATTVPTAATEAGNTATETGAGALRCTEWLQKSSLLIRIPHFDCSCFCLPFHTFAGTSGPVATATGAFTTDGSNGNSTGENPPGNQQGNNTRGGMNSGNGNNGTSNPDFKTLDNQFGRGNQTNDGTFTGGNARPSGGGRWGNGRGNNTDENHTAENGNTRERPTGGQGFTRPTQGPDEERRRLKRSGVSFWGVV